MMPINVPATNGHDSWSTPGTSRAINVTTARADVEALCAKHKTSISAIETLPNGAGTRVVMTNPDDAATMRKAFGKAVIEGKVEREHWAAARK
ncbi:hypothetical protein [Sphingomonas sp.]|jgi:hypothetical protein|uniref:hypothetical protein n=1 Tax=Sphingomonas sp. TaxID=28214 RepID=UPI002E37BE21|nr:hypothetical protein [Sphingomonas sp.]HEX4694936.1 hypothetical protein [Sphingomonas sp.]